MTIENSLGGLSLESAEDEANRLRKLAEMQQESERVASLTVDERAAGLASLDRKYGVGGSGEEEAAFVLNSKVEQIALPNDILISNSYPNSIIVSDHDERGKFYIAVSIDPSGVVLGHRFNLISTEAMPDPATGKQSDERKIVVGNGQQYGQSAEEQVNLMQIVAKYGGVYELRSIIDQANAPGSEVKNFNQEVDDMRIGLMADEQVRETAVKAVAAEKARQIEIEKAKAEAVFQEENARYQEMQRHAHIKELAEGKAGQVLNFMSGTNVENLNDAFAFAVTRQDLIDVASKNGDTVEFQVALAERVWERAGHDEESRVNRISKIFSSNTGLYNNSTKYGTFRNKLGEKIGWRK